MRSLQQKIRLFFSNQTLTRAIILVFLAVFVPLAILLAWYASNERDSSLEKTREISLESLASQVGSEVELVLSHAYEDIRLLADNTVIKAAPVSADVIEAQKSEMEKVQGVYGTFADITLIDVNGDVITSTTYEYQGDWKGKRWFREALAGDMAVSEPYILLNPDRVVMSFAAPVTGEDNGVAAVISGQMSMAVIQQIAGDVMLGETGHARIVSEDGNYIAHPDESKILTPLEYPVLLSSAAGTSQTFKCEDAEGKNVVGVSAALDVSRYTGGNTWHVIMCQAESEAFGPVHDASKRVATWAVIGFILFILISGLLIRKETRPLHALSVAAQKVGAGEFTHRVPVAGTKEFRQMAAAFNEMVRNLQMSEGLRSEHSLLRKLQALGTALAGALSPEDVLKIMADGIQEIFASDVTWILLADEDGGYLETRVFIDKYARGKANDLDSGFTAIGGRVNLKRSSNLLVKTFKEGRPLFLDDITPFEDLSKNDAVLGIMGESLGMASVNLVPLALQDKNIGVIVFGRTQGRSLSDAEKRIILVFAYEAAISLERARLHAVEMGGKEELVRLSDLRARLLHILSHELKTPLTSLKSSSRLLQESDINDMSNETLERLVSNIVRATERLVDVADDIYPVADVLSGSMKMDFKDTDCRKVVGQAVKAVSPLLAKKSQKINLSHPDSMEPVRADRERLRQVLVNLITNAGNLSSEGAEIDVGIRDEEDEVVFVVKDRGIGISEEDQKSIFDGFYQADSETVRRAGGRGLGLMFAKTIVSLHGGKIWLESKLGQGSTFYFSIPKQP